MGGVCRKTGKNSKSDAIVMNETENEEKYI